MPGSIRPPSSLPLATPAPFVHPLGVRNQRNFRFGEAQYFPDQPTHGPWRTARSHFRLILSHDFHLRHLDEPANLPRPWGQLLWVPEPLAHAPVARTRGRHFWIVPKPPMLASRRWLDRRIMPIRDAASIDTAVRLYDEYQRGEEALSLELDTHGRLLIGLAGRSLRGRPRMRS